MFHHGRIEQATGLKIYFADPHSPWQRGTNENTNGLLRQYFPKGADLNQVSDERLAEVADELNNRPRLVLGNRTQPNSCDDGSNHRFATTDRNRRVYPVVLIDAIVLKIREGSVGNRPVYVAIGISLDGYRDVLGMWMGPSGGEGAKQWLNMLSDLRNRGILEVCIVCCDGLKGLPEAISTTWPLAQVQTCVVHLVRNSLRYTQRRDWKQVAGELKEVYTAPSLEAAEFAFEMFAERWAARYPALIGLWRNSWTEFTPFLDYPLEVRKLIYTTNGIESLNARFRAAVRRRGHFPDEQSAL